jgi:hypothetical protein
MSTDSRLAVFKGMLGACTAPLALVLFGGCTETTVPAPGVYHPTLIGVAPDVFLGSVPCVDSEGAMRTYVATVFNVEYLPDGSLVTTEDVATGDAVVGGTDTSSCHADADPGTTPRATVGFALPSSGPVDCHDPVAFARVIQGHRYRAEIDGYNRNDLVPLAPGVRVLVDPVTGERVAPQWKFSCGDDCPEHVRDYVTRAVGACKLLSGSSETPSGPASVTIAADALTGAACGSGSGEIERVEVHYDALGQSATVSSACGEEIVLDDVPVRGTLTVSVLAYEAGNPDPRWGTTCSATPVAGLTVPATCAPLHDDGALDVDPAAALAVLGSNCDGLTELPGELKLELTQEAGQPIPEDAQRAPIYVDASSCGQNVSFMGVGPGPASVLATLSSGPTELGRALCTTENVVPGETVLTTCSMEP